MAINRKAYTSLLESIVGTVSEGDVAMGNPGRTKTPTLSGASVTTGGSVGPRSNQMSGGQARRPSALRRPSPSGWGSSGVFGAKDASALANNLALQGSQTTDAQSDGVGNQMSAGTRAGRPTTGGPSRPSRKPATVGTASIGGRVGSSTSTQMSSGVASRPMPRPRPIGGTIGRLGTRGGIREEWDEIDDILAEGIELYGEEGMEIILSHFAETGEMSEELAELLGG